MDYNAGVCFKIVYMICVDEQKLPRNHTPSVQKNFYNFFKFHKTDFSYKIKLPVGVQPY